MKVCSFSANSPEVSAGGQILGLILVKWKFTVDYVKIDQNYDQDLQSLLGELRFFQNKFESAHRQLLYKNSLYDILNYIKISYL